MKSGNYGPRSMVRYVLPTPVLSRPLNTLLLIFSFLFFLSYRLLIVFFVSLPFSSLFLIRMADIVAYSFGKVYKVSHTATPVCTHCLSSSYSDMGTITTWSNYGVTDYKLMCVHSGIYGLLSIVRPPLQWGRPLPHVSSSDYDSTWISEQYDPSYSIRASLRALINISK